MTLPTGTISMSEVNAELGRASSATTSLDEKNVRTTAAQISGTGVLSGTISMNNLRGAKGTTCLVGYSPVSVQTGPSTFFNGYSSGNGSWSPTPVLDLAATGAVITALYTQGTPSGPFSVLSINITQTYTGSFILYGSTTVNDPWPNTLLMTLPYSSTSTWYAPVGSAILLSNVRSVRIQKA